MPKAAVDENSYAAAREGNVDTSARGARHRYMHAVTQPAPVQFAPQLHLRFGVLSGLCPHPRRDSRR
jgi:hypothetical protein